MTTHPAITRDLAYWRALVAANVRNATPTQIDAIAARCFDSAAANELGSDCGVGVWHAAAEALGFAGRCPCFPCSRARGEL